MNFSFTEISGKRQHSRAISVCAYMSDKFDVDKHLKPFAEFVTKGQEGYDILVFREPGMSVPTGPTTRVFDVTSPTLGYGRHLWRYLGGELGYDWTWFRGMDTPEIPAREERLALATELVRNHAVIWQCPNRRPLTVMGRCGTTLLGGKSLAAFVQKSVFDHKDWNCDEHLLTDWLHTEQPRVTLALDGPLTNKPHQLSWVLSQLCEGQHLTVVKDRDDRN